jgi:histidinol-phosphatase (PHP family)
MQFSNFHTHCVFCDGTAQPEEYIKEAIFHKMDALGFSSHAPVPFENVWSIKPGKIDDYCNTILLQKEKYFNKLKIFLALEADYIPGIISNFDSFRKQYHLDYIIGSVHLVKKNEKLWFIDGPEEGYVQGIKNIFDNNIREAVESYYLQEAEMIANEKPDIIGHLDKVKMYNHDRFFSENNFWYMDAVENLLQTISKTGTIVEVNTRGQYKGKTKDLFPSTKILKRCLALKIPVTISSDAHKPEELTLHFPEALELLRSIGYKSIHKFQQGKWVEVFISE